MELNNYFYQSSKHLSAARLTVSHDKKVENIDIFHFVDDLGFDYRSVLTVEYVDALVQSSKKFIGGDLVYEKKYEIDLQSGVALSNLSVDADLPAEVRCGGHFDLYISARRYVPLIGRSCTAEEYGKRGVVYSEILFIHLIFCKEEKSPPHLCANSFVYESYDQLGFLGVDEDLFNSFIVEKLGHGKHDLLKSFTTTEIANELFQAGLMILCWGITPWVYMVNSIEQGEDGSSFPVGLPVCQSGSYVFLEKIEEISVIPGVALREWDTNFQGAWPKMKLNGVGGVVKVDLCVAKAINPYDTSVPDYLPMPFFNLNRVDIILEESVPILSADIESCML
ncbi:MAG: hypothetical protein EON58_07890 [Alphaproteobacteria bacterium]|nr:MAG: hypothetical protein EON58_07890 [Alphaproteobacteria bacterium]